MGLLFSPVKNRFVAEGIAEGEKKADARLEAWLTSNPEIQKLIDEGKAKAPPKLDDEDDRG